ncbi:MAG: protoheme IX farnesyltransferase [Bacteroidia bacterium]|nr:protoheme IX farnesyltransferase [Bacteroidia bacterium]
MSKNNFRQHISVLIGLIRVRLSLMVTISAMTGYFLTGSSPKVALIFLFAGVFLLAAGTSVLNQVQECRYDALMKRTDRRPIPAGEISRGKAFVIAVILIISGTFLLSINGWLPMALGLSNVVFYNLIYTPLKTRSWLAIIPGALVGAVPPLIGWTSAGLNLFHLNILFVAIFVFLWQIPHFWLLMIKYGKEYELAGFSSISKLLNERQIKSVVFGWGVITSLFLMLFPLFGFSLKPILMVSLIAMNFLFITLFHRFLFEKGSPKTIRKAFVLINSYAVVVFVVLVINAMIS